ncbi:MAG TPA: hypothetical protein VMV83_06030 [Rectinemataceae bacterium]|nr:hypothetical protein [Rectinemataceae bacterium]
MKIVRSSLALFIVAVFLAGCAQPSAPVASGSTAKVSVNFTVPAMNSALQRAIGARSASASKALMLLTRYSVSLYDYYTNTSTTLPDVVISSPNPGGGGNNSTVLQLYPDRTYDIYLYGYNDGQSSSSPVVYGYKYGIPISSSPYQSISMTLQPYNYNYHDYPSVGQYWTDTWTSLPSIVSVGSSGPSFTQIGGEMWSMMYVPYTDTNTFAVNIAPADPNALIFAGFFNASGESVGGYQVSPSFSGGTTNVVTLETGINPYDTLYLGYIVILNSSVSTSLLYPQVTVSVVSPSHYDDSYENNDTMSSAFWLYPPYQSGTIFSLSTNVYGAAKAYDPDWYAFSAPVDGSYTFKATSIDGASNGNVIIFDSNGNQIGSSWGDYDAGNASTTFTTWPMNLTAGSYYYVEVNLNLIDATLNMPILGGSYDLSISY